jgi:hypothetical protein
MRSPLPRPPASPTIIIVILQKRKMVSDRGKSRTLASTKAVLRMFKTAGPKVKALPLWHQCGTSKFVSGARPHILAGSVLWLDAWP